MADRAYTVAEIDALRGVCESKWLYGAFVHPVPAFAVTRDGRLYQSHQSGRTYQTSEKDIGVEQLVRTYMLAGLTAEDIRAEHEASERAAYDAAYQNFMDEVDMMRSLPKATTTP